MRRPIYLLLLSSSKSEERGCYSLLWHRIFFNFNFFINLQRSFFCGRTQQHGMLIDILMLQISQYINYTNSQTQTQTQTKRKHANNTNTQTTQTRKQRKHTNNANAGRRMRARRHKRNTSTHTTQRSTRTTILFSNISTLTCDSKLRNSTTHLSPQHARTTHHPCTTHYYHARRTPLNKRTEFARGKSKKHTNVNFTEQDIFSSRPRG
jgi:hypothetical protein